MMAGLFLTSSVQTRGQAWAGYRVESQQAALPAE